MVVLPPGPAAGAGSRRPGRPSDRNENEKTNQNFDMTGLNIFASFLAPHYFLSLCIRVDDCRVLNTNWRKQQANLRYNSVTKNLNLPLVGQLRGGGCEDVSLYLTSIGLSQYIASFQKENISWLNMFELTREDLRELGMSDHDLTTFLSALV